MNGAKVFLRRNGPKEHQSETATPKDIRYIDVMNPRSEGESEMFPQGMGDITALPLPKSTEIKYPLTKRDKSLVRRDQ